MSSRIPRLFTAALCALALAARLQAGDCDEDTAVQAMAKAVKADPKNALNNFNLATAYYNKKCYDDAVEAFERTLKLVKGDSKEHKEMRFECASVLGGLYYAKQDYQSSIQYFKRALEIKNSDKFCLNGVSLAYAKAGDSENAVVFLKKTLLADPRNAEAHYRLAVLLNKKAEDLLAEKREAVKDEGERAKLTLDKADPKLFRELVETFEDAARNADPGDNKEILLMSSTRLGELYRDSGQVEKAISSFKKSLSLEPKDYTAHFLLGKLYYEKKDYASMTEHYKKAVEIDPNQANARFNLGVSYISQEQYADAFEQFKAITELDSSNSEAYALMGTTLERAVDQLNAQGASQFTAEEYRLALDNFERVLALDPKNKTAKGYRERSEEALEKQFAKLMKDAKAFLKAKKSEDAAEALEKAISLKPEDPEAKELQGQIKANIGKLVSRYLAQGDKFKGMGDYDKAREWWKRAQAFKGGKQQAAQRLAALNKKTESELAGALNRAKAAMKAKRLREAQIAYRVALGVDKFNADAKNGLVQVNTLITDKVKVLSNKASKAMDAGEKSAARKAYEEILKLEPSNSDANEAIKKITGTQSSAAANASKVKELYYKGVDQYVNNKIKEAIATWEELLRLDETHQDAKKNIERAKAKLRALANL